MRVSDTVFNRLSFSPLLFTAVNSSHKSGIATDVIVNTSSLLHDDPFKQQGLETPKQTLQHVSLL